MGKLRKTMRLAMFAGFVLPPLAAAIAKSRIRSEGGATSDELALATIFEGTELASRATAFRGGSVLCWYGGVQLDLRGATLDPDGAELRVRCLFGGLELIVPETWRVEAHATNVLGGFSDDSAGPAGEGPVLDVEVLSVFGGVSITTRPTWGSGAAGGWGEPADFVGGSAVSSPSAPVSASDAPSPGAATAGSAMAGSAAVGGATVGGAASEETAAPAEGAPSPTSFETAEAQAAAEAKAAVERAAKRNRRTRS